MSPPGHIEGLERLGLQACLSPHPVTPSPLLARVQPVTALHCRLLGGEESSDFAPGIFVNGENKPEALCLKKSGLHFSVGMMTSFVFETRGMHHLPRQGGVQAGPADHTAGLDGWTERAGPLLTEAWSAGGPCRAQEPRGSGPWRWAPSPLPRTNTWVRQWGLQGPRQD